MNFNKMTPFLVIALALCIYHRAGYHVVVAHRSSHLGQQDPMALKLRWRGAR